MEHLIFITYILLFATGFMGISALFFLKIRSGWHFINIFLVFQFLYVTGLILVGAFFYLQNITESGRSTASNFFPKIAFGMTIVSSFINGGIYCTAALGIRKFHIRKYKVLKQNVFILAIIVVFQTVIELGLFIAQQMGMAFAGFLLHSNLWQLSGYLLTGLTIAGFGIMLIVAAREEERDSIKLLLRGYGFSAIAFAPLGFVEWALNHLVINPLQPLSLDYLFYLAWNLVAIVAFTKSLIRGETAGPVLSAIPEETVSALGLTSRECDMALMIAQGLANKEIAAELGISAATVRTHIYNLYRKVGARSRVELINKLRR